MALEMLNDCQIAVGLLLDCTGLPLGTFGFALGSAVDGNRQGAADSLPMECFRIVQEFLVGGGA